MLWYILALKNIKPIIGYFGLGHNDFVVDLGIFCAQAGGLELNTPLKNALLKRKSLVMLFWFIYICYSHTYHPLYLSISPVLWHKCQREFKRPAAPQQGMLGALIVWWPASFWLQWPIAEGTVHNGSPAQFPTKPTEETKKKEGKCML